MQLRAAGQAAFKSAMDSAAKSITGVDTSAQKADKSTTAMTGDMAKGSSKLRSSVGTLAKWAGGAAAIAGTTRYLKSAAQATMDLGKSTLALQRSTGVSAETASQWGAVLKARGVDTKAFQIGLTKFSKTMVGGADDIKKYSASFKELGVSRDALRGGDVNSVLLQTADAFAAMDNPARRAAKAQELFGRQAQTLLPMMMGGSEGIREQLAIAEKYGASMGSKSAGGVKEMIARQRELAIASEGVKVSLGQAMMPVILSLSQALLGVVRILQPLLRNATAVKIVLALLTTAFITLKVATIASTIATLSFNAAFLLIPLAVVALAVALIYAYKKVDWFRNAVDAAAKWVKGALVAVFNWIKSNWVLVASLLGGPFVAAAIQIIRNWDRIKQTVKNGVEAVKGFLKGLPSAALQLGKDLVSALVNGLKAMPSAVLDAIKSLLPGKMVGLGEKIGLWAQGGLVPTRQWGIVGEDGPELLQLPGGTRITPLPAPAIAAPSLSGGAPGGGSQTTANFWLDRRLIATAVAEDTADQQARR